MNERKKEVMMLLKVTVLMVHIVGSINVGANLSGEHSQGRCMCSVVNKWRLPLSTKTVLLLVCCCCISQELPSSMSRQYAAVLGRNYRLDMRDSLEYWSTLAQFYVLFYSNTMKHDQYFHHILFFAFL